MNRWIATLAALLLSGAPLAWATGEHDDDSHAGHAHATTPDDDHHDAHAGEEAHDDQRHDERVPLGRDVRAEFGIEVAVAGPDTIETYLTVPGEVRANADRLAHIVPRFSGIVMEVRVHQGDRVEKGQVLAIVESDESLAPFEVRTLIGGIVIEKHITLGEAVSRDHDAFVIADLSTVWVDLTVYQRDLTRVRAGQTVRVFVGHDTATGEARIHWVTPIVDETTRTATARVELPNRDGAWRPGMFVRGRILVDRTAAAVAVPRTALQTYEGGTVVFVEADGAFEPRTVRTGRAGRDIVEIRHGLSAGERYARTGGFTLKAELGRESLDHAGHAH
ncbi:efflux RND transporter periplasmic adaptor subunit [bacterium]|nr:efflux RND transporter periplasmic adaptor subunit [bacterium]